MKLRCPLHTCRQTFQWHDTARWPNDCPVCGGFIGTDGKDAVAMPYIATRSAKTKVVDNVFREAAAAAEARIDQAVAMTPGASREDFNHLKITDYRPNMVEGEAAVKLPDTSPEFKQNVAALQTGGVQVQNSGMINLAQQAPQFAAASGAGPEPYAGARAMKRLRSVHSQNVDPRMMGSAVTNYPTMAERQPGYVPRA